jgi:hypothetical protein
MGCGRELLLVVGSRPHSTISIISYVKAIEVYADFPHQLEPGLGVTVTPSSRQRTEMGESGTRRLKRPLAADSPRGLTRRPRRTSGADRLIPPGVVHPDGVVASAYVGQTAFAATTIRPVRLSKTSTVRWRLPERTSGALASGMGICRQESDAAVQFYCLGGVR